MNLRKECTFFASTALCSMSLACAQGVLMVSNTNEPVAGFTGETYGARAVFTPGFDAGGYGLSGFTVELGDNSSVSHGPVHVILYGSNDPLNLDQNLSDFFAPVPPAPGTYYFEWPTNYFIPPQFSDNPPYYYHVLLVPASGDYLTVAYTTSTNFAYHDAWTFYPGASAINGTLGICPLVNIYATVLPPPKLWPIRLRDGAVLADGSFQFGFTNSPSFSFSVYITTNLALPFTNWIYSGSADNVASNYFQFSTGPNVVHNPAFPPRIYFRVTSP